jgi:hypothetical protein
LSSQESKRFLIGHLGTVHLVIENGVGDRPQVEFQLR